MPTSAKNDEDWPLIRKDLINKLDAFITEVQTQQQNHNNVLYGYMDAKGKWQKGLVQIVQEGEERKNKVSRAAGWLIYGVLSAVGIAITEVLFKFWKFITNH